MAEIKSFTDEELSALLKNGQEQALSYVFGLHSRSLQYFAGKLIQDDIEAEDIVANCLYKFWEKRSDFNTAQEIKAFLFISCRNACLNHLRGLKRKSAAQENYFLQLEKSEESILTEIIETEFLNLLNAEIEKLPEKMREIFKLIYFDGLKTEEIAARLDLSVKTVRNQKAKAVELLKTAFFKRGISAAFMLALQFYLDKN